MSSLSTETRFILIQNSFQGLHPPSVWSDANRNFPACRVLLVCWRFRRSFSFFILACSTDLKPLFFFSKLVQKRKFKFFSLRFSFHNIGVFNLPCSLSVDVFYCSYIYKIVLRLTPTLWQNPGESTETNNNMILGEHGWFVSRVGCPKTGLFENLSLDPTRFVWGRQRRNAPGCLAQIDAEWGNSGRVSQIKKKLFSACSDIPTLSRGKREKAI